MIFPPIKLDGHPQALRSMNLKSLMRFPSNTRELVRSKSSFAFSDYDFFALTSLITTQDVYNILAHVLSTRVLITKIQYGDSTKTE